MLIIDALVYEIGSTTTTVSAFDRIDSNSPVFLGQGVAPTSIGLNDVTIGLEEAKSDLMRKLSIPNLHAHNSYACSSAAGGLKMSVHGLVYDMTVKAAKEAALGAGANIVQLTAGAILEHHLTFIKEKQINIVLLAGGVDYGETEIILQNAEKIASLRASIPVIYAGNIANQEQIKAIFTHHAQDEYLTITENVYPKIDILNVEPLRKHIQNIFEQHIVHAPGMENIKQIVNKRIVPVPGAVLEASILLAQVMPDVLTLDVGGATTDVHSVTTGSKEIQEILTSPEPVAKRTVEGDLGVYVNRMSILRRIGEETLQQDLACTKEHLDYLLANYSPIPTNNQIPLVSLFTKYALIESLNRHSGKYYYNYTLQGRKKYAEGKDLTSIKTIIGTGGALTRLPNGVQIIQDALSKLDLNRLKPKQDASILLDTKYIMASCGVLASTHPDAALLLLQDSLQKEAPHVSTINH